MHDRALLGPADVDDADLTALVAASLDADPAHVELLSSRATTVDYDLPAITTAGRYWVRGEARVSGHPTEYSLFVKHVQAWSRSQFFESVPPELRTMAAAGVPWRTEPLAYRSDLGDRLPHGLTMPQALAVRDLDDESCSIWLREIATVTGGWDLDRYATAADLLGRLAASAAVAELADVGRFAWSIHVFLHGRLEAQVLPMLRDDGIWRHPLVSAAFDDDLCRRLQLGADLATAYTDELAGLPLLTGHGDACPNNLLVSPDHDGFVLIDYGFWNRLPVGFDLGQLVVGDIQTGDRPAADLREIEERCLPAYVAGLRAEGCDIDESVVRRAHALQLMLFAGLSSLPVEDLGSEPTPTLVRHAHGRAELARFCLDLVAATAPA